MRWLVPVVLLLAGARGWGDVLHVDLDAWGDVGMGVTADGWSVKGITKYSDEGVCFNAGDDEAISPLYPGLVTQVVARVRSSAGVMSRHLSLIPQVTEANAQTNQAQETVCYCDQTFVWRASERVRQFSFKILGSGSGNWGVAAVDVYLDRVERPVNLQARACWSDAFEANWNAEVRARRFEVAVGRVDEVPPTFTSLKTWDFSVLTNMTSNTVGFVSLNPPAELGDVRGTHLCLQGMTGGHLQVGKSDVRGVLALPLPACARRTALLTAFQNAADKPEGSVPVKTVTAAGQTNGLSNLELTFVPRETRMELPDDAAVLLIESRGSRRVRIVGADIVSDYVEGSVSTNWVQNQYAEASECAVKGLFPGRWVWRVRAFDGNEWDSPWSRISSVTLESTRPQYADRGFGLIVR